MRALQGAIRLIARVETGSTHAVACLPAMPWERLLAERPLQDIPRTFALLHPLAPQTHATAARAAIAAASGMRHVPAPEAHVALVREQAQEHGVYFLMTLPEVLGLVTDGTLATALGCITAAGDRDTLASSLHALLAAMAGPSAIAAPGNDLATPSGYIGQLVAELAAQLPPGAPQHLANRVLARRWRALHALPRLLHAPPGRSLRAGGTSGEGWACLPSARGLLMHRLALDDGRLVSYRLDTPTMRHFGPRGSWVQAMQETFFPDTVTAQAAGALLAAVLDPCLPVIMAGEFT
jgi:coenzyme F420-reducing hydrogenase alpha subunit